MSPVTRKPIFGVCDPVRLKPACSASDIYIFFLPRLCDIFCLVHLKIFCCSLPSSHMVKAGFVMTWHNYDVVRNKYEMQIRNNCKHEHTRDSQKVRGHF